MTTESQNDIMNIENVESEIKNNKREILKSEKMLLIIALSISILCDRLFFNIIMKQVWNIFYFTAIFEICFIILYCVFNWQKIYKKPLLWVSAVLIILLCVWNFIFDYMSSYGILTFPVIPATLMLFTQVAAENHELKNISGMILSWFSGWLIKPFTAIIKCTEVLSEMFFPKNNSTGPVIKKILIALLITVPLVTVLLFLLSGADEVFGYFINKIFASFNIFDFFWHSVLIFIGFFLFYSFFWNGRYGKTQNEIIKTEKKEYKADNLILYIILGSVLIIYILFCIVQFAYLFASAGLPDGITYSDYARNGFAQIVAISGINLIIFGLMIKFGKIHKPVPQSVGAELASAPDKGNHKGCPYDKPGEKDIVLKIMLYMLVAMTGIMLVSGFKRLGLYIYTFGMTFLRLISAWFIIYLALVLILCVIRLLKEKTPLFACCAILLLVSYNILGYINPDSFIVNYNLSENVESSTIRIRGIYEWTDTNYSYVLSELSDDAVNTLLDNGLDKEKYADMFKQRYNESVKKYNFASRKLASRLSEFAGED